MKGKSAKNIIEMILDTLTVLTVIATVLFAIVGICFNVVYEKKFVKGYSMYPTLNSTVPNKDIEGDVVFVNKYAKFKKDDIVVADVKWYSEGPIVKRVILTPGDVMIIREENENYNLYVNGKLKTTKEKTTTSIHGELGGTEAYYQTYLNFFENPKYEKNIITINNEKYIICNENEYFLMGDNWSESTDCVKYGVVKKSNISGRVERIVTYRHGHTFAMIKEMFAITFIPNWVN